MNDDFDELFEQYRKKKEKPKRRVKLGALNPEELDLWQDVKTKDLPENCGVCRRKLDNEDLVEPCDKCGRYFHYKHIREWVKIKGTCPVCKQRIDFVD